MCVITLRMPLELPASPTAGTHNIHSLTAPQRCFFRYKCSFNLGTFSQTPGVAQEALPWVLGSSCEPGAPKAPELRITVESWSRWKDLQGTAVIPGPICLVLLSQPEHVGEGAPGSPGTAIKERFTQHLIRLISPYFYQAVVKPHPW